MAEQTFTAMSDDGIDAMLQRVGEIAADGYHMSLNPSDLGSLILALKNAYEHTADMGCEGTDDIDLADEEAGNWAASFLGDIAEQMGIEFI